MEYQVYNSDCRHALADVLDESLDLTITSPPYCIGKAYDVHTTISGFQDTNRPIINTIIAKTKPGGSICWQIGHHVSHGEIFPLDYFVYQLFKEVYPSIKLRNRIVWHFEHGAHCRNRFSGRHEAILWFTKGDGYYFDLDAVRVKQKYPGKKHYRGTNKGKYSCNPLGKNPGDIWSIPNVKANHIEKTTHPCQFPIALAQRLIRALSPSGGRVADPFMGVGTTGAAALLESRSFVGMEIHKPYYDIAVQRLEAALSGSLRFREIDRQVFDPRNAGSVGQDPIVA